MESHTKSGKVYLQLHKTGKKWRPVLLSLFSPSSSAVGRLEIQDMGGGGTGGDHSLVLRRHHQHPGERKQKVVRLSELINIQRLPPNAEACPMENMSAFCVETQDRTMVFAANKDDCVDWVEKLCDSTFQRGGGAGCNQLHMEDNQIYASADEASEFWVVVQRTDAAARCGLQGSHWLQVGRESLQLRDTQTKSVVREWPYELLRRFGKDKLAITIEAGRRCDSGPGTFTFETQQAEKIFSLIQSTIKRKTSSITSSHQNQESEKFAETNIQAHSPLPKLPDVTTISAILEKDIQEEQVAQAQPAPITLMPLPQVPTHDNPSAGDHCCQSDPVYADPADCKLLIPKPPSSKALYVDPASVLPLKPPGVPPTSHSSVPNPCFDIDHPDSDYSEVYDKVSVVQSKQPDFHSNEITHSFENAEAIYTEPVNENGKSSHKNKDKPDPFAHLYAQVCKTTPSPSPTTSSNPTHLLSAPPVTTDNKITTSDTDKYLDDVIYENLGVI